MSLDTFEKTKSQYERKMARQRQLDLMEAAASGSSGTFDLEPGPTTPNTTTSTPPTSRASLAHAPPQGAIESARRFLWDEDEDDYQAPSRQFGGGDSPANQNVNLVSNEESQGYSTTSPNAQGGGGGGLSFLSKVPRFSAVTGTTDSPTSSSPGGVNLAPRRHWQQAADASPSAESEEYLADVDYTRRRRQGGSFLSPVGDCCLATLQTIVGILALLCEYIFSCCGNCTPKQRLLVLGVFVGILILIITVVAVTKDNGKNDVVVPGGGNAEISDMVRFNSIRRTILDSAFTAVDHLDTQGTAQNLAARWLTDDDPAKLEPDDDALLQRYALATFFFSTYVRSEYQDENSGSGIIQDEWNNMDYWMTDKGICMWYGVACPPHLHEGQEEIQYNENSDVLHLNLTANNIRGTVPSELRALENLISLDLGKNDIEGTIPTALTEFRYLEEFYLEENNMSGTLPTELGKLTLLKDLYVGTNRFEGTIPSELNKLTELRGLGLDECYLTGTIPYIWDLKKLLILYLDSNQLTGRLSDDIRYLTELVDFRVRKNFLNGTMPIEFHWLTKLQLLYMDDNAFTGTVPEVFDRTPRIEELHLYKNQFTGVFPDSIEKLADLKILYMDNNKFQGTIPFDWGNLNDVNTMYLFNNELIGSIPSELGKMEDLKDFQVQNNKLNSQIPTELANCFKLEKLELQDNEFTGTVPTEFGSLQKLKMMKVYRTKLTGSMPEQVCALTQDFSLDFLAADCNTQGGGTLACDCCNSCYP